MLKPLPSLIKQHWKITIFFLLLLPVLIRLGYWQIERQQEKKQELTVYQQRQELPAIPLESLLSLYKDQANSEEKLRYRNIKMSGRFDDKKYWLIDNQPRTGKVGYEIVMPFTSDLGTVLVNRGWLEAPPRREQLPVVSTPQETIEITGYLYTSQQNAVIKNTASDLAVDWPKRVIHLNVNEALSQLELAGNNNQLVIDKQSMIVRINADSQGAFLTDWPLINTKPEKHQAYAVQWFAMAFALIVLYGWFLLRSYKE